MMWKKRYNVDLAAIETDVTPEFESLCESESCYEFLISISEYQGDTKEQARYIAEYQAWKDEHAHVLGSVAYQRFLRKPPSPEEEVHMRALEYNTNRYAVEHFLSMARKDYPSESQVTFESRKQQLVDQEFGEGIYPKYVRSEQISFDDVALKR